MPRVDTNMARLLGPIGLGLLAALATPLFAEPTPGPPDWADAAGSVYLNLQDAPAAQQPPVIRPTPERQQPVVDPAVAQARHEEPAISVSVNETAAENIDARRLAPPSRSAEHSHERAPKAERGGHAPADLRPLVRSLTPAGSLYTILSALAIVIGAFLILVWLLRRGGPKTAAALPADVVSVLGRVPLAARQFAELLRVGNKLVLVSITPDGAETLTEVTDPVEVDRLVGLCQQYSPHSTTKAFEQVFRQLSRESAPGGYLGGESLPQSISSAAAAYRAQRGENARG